MAPRFFARQLSHPTGLIGRIVGRLMNRGNAGLNAFAAAQLDLQPTDRVLEIGFGGGAMLETLVRESAFVAGIDRSETMVRQARARHAALVDARRLDLRDGEVDALPFPSASFEKVLTVNTVYFWPSLATAFAEARRVLAPGGIVAVGFRPKEHMARMGLPADNFTMRTPDEIVASLESAGFAGCRVTRPRPSTTWVVVVARRTRG